MPNLPIWSDDPSIGIRFNQTGYSSPTIFPQPENYQDKYLFFVDLAKAQNRETSREEWLWEQREEARIDYLEQKYEREEWE